MSIGRRPGLGIAEAITACIPTSRNVQVAGESGQEPKDTQLALRVTPLFETLADLTNAGDTLRSLFQVPWYRKNLRCALCSGGHMVRIMLELLRCLRMTQSTAEKEAGTTLQGGAW